MLRMALLLRILSGGRGGRRRNEGRKERRKKEEGHAVVCREQASIRSGPRVCRVVGPQDQLPPLRLLHYLRIESSHR